MQELPIHHVILFLKWNVRLNYQVLRNNNMVMFSGNPDRHSYQII